MIKIALAESIKIAINLKMPKSNNAYAYRAPEGNMLRKLDDYLSLNPKAFDPGKDISGRFGRLADRVQTKGHKDTADWLRSKQQQAEAMEWLDPRAKSRQTTREILGDMSKDISKVKQKLEPSEATKSLYYRAGSRALPLIGTMTQLEDIRSLAAANPTIIDTLGNFLRTVIG